ncbi:MAG TPA: DUF4082 domain-containing protein [Longimicrobium sp.]|nr:DUF4082 domain-containing protein [Longimicrobium sp.]
MKRSFLAAAAALALAACSDSGPLLQKRSPPADASKYIVWSPSDSIYTNQVPESTGYAGPDGWQVGTVFTVDDTVLVIGFKYYKAVGETGSHTARLYTSGGTLVGTRGFTGETASGWQRTMLTTTFSIPPGTYVVTVNTNTYQVKSFGWFTNNGPISRSHLEATGGKYGQPIHSFPASGSGSSFFVDVIYRPKLCNTTTDNPCP